MPCSHRSHWDCGSRNAERFPCSDHLKIVCRLSVHLTDGCFRFGRACPSLSITAGRLSFGTLAKALSNFILRLTTATPDSFNVCESVCQAVTSSILESLSCEMVWWHTAVPAYLACTLASRREMARKNRAFIRNDSKKGWI